MPSPEYLCQGNFTGVFGSDREAWMSINTDARGYLIGDVWFEDDAQFSLSGSCNQIGNYAELSISLNGGSPYVARIYYGDDGRIYMEGYQPGTPVTFAFMRD